MEANEFKALFLPHHAKLYRTAYALLRNTQDAEDIVQEAYLKLWNKRDELGIAANTEAYCVMLTRNLCLDLLRNARYRTDDTPADTLTLRADDDTERELEERDEAGQLKRLIGRLPEVQQKVVWLRDVNGCSMEEIEQATGLSAVNIRATLCKARKRIREQFNRLTKGR